MLKYKQQKSFLFILLLTTILPIIRFTDCHENSNALEFKLIHRYQLERTHGNGANPITMSQRFRQLLHNDAIRLWGISQNLRVQNGGRRKIQDWNNYYDQDCINGSRNYRPKAKAFGKMPLYSGADSGIGQYFAQFMVGSPSQEFVLIIDTASDLTWMKCRYRCRRESCRTNFNRRRVFRPEHSSSFKTLPCSSSLCKIGLANLFSLSRCPSPMDPCAYDYRYVDGSVAVGLFANESVTFNLVNGEHTRLHNVLIGCSESASGPTIQSVDGVMGLGYSNYSFAVKAAERFGGKFSYCLVDHFSPKNLSSYLIFGSHKGMGKLVGRMHYTQLGLIESVYALSLKSISIGGSLLNIPPHTWNVTGVGGVIIDSGSTLTALTLPAYKPVMDALELSLVNFKNLNQEIKPFEYCFNSMGFDESIVPRLVFHFVDGARFTPPVKSYVIDVDEGVKCLGFVPAAWPGVSVIGNIMQQNHLWEFDLTNSRLGFATSSCN